MPMQSEKRPQSPAVLIRALQTHEELLACVELQKETWGQGFSELVPLSLLKVTERLGGVVAGAFDAAGRLVGFVFGMTGVENGKLVHWSDMLAVREEVRDQGIGQRLKKYQRETVRRLGVEVIYWTYDPLVAKNAHINLNRLGVRVVEYVVDMYGPETDSTLHRGLGTDRFVVAWPVGVEGEARPEAPERTGGGPVSEPTAVRDAPIVNAGVPDAAGARAGPDVAPERFGAVPPPVLCVEIPLDIHKVQAASVETAARWRAATRRAFVWCLAHGYRVTGFVRDHAADRGYYLLSLTAPLSEAR